MTSVDTAPATHGPASVFSSTDRSAMARGVARQLTTRVSVIVLVGALAVLILRPLYEIMHLAFANGAHGFHAVGDTPLATRRTLDRPSRPRSGWPSVPRRWLLSWA